MPNSRSAEQIGQAADDYLAGQIGRLDDELQTMKAAAAEEIATAVERGLMRAVSNPALWEAASVAMRAQAQSAAGGLLLGGMRAMFTRAAWIVAILAGVYALGGWGAVVALIKGHGASS